LPALYHRGQGAILVPVGAKMLLSDVVHVPPLLALAIGASL
jgi:hypothetical protein